MPLVQYLYLRRELPYGRYLRHTLVYAAIGAAMWLAVRLTARWMPAGWPGLMLQVLLGGAVYGGLCLALWLVTGNRAILSLLRIRGAGHKKG